MILIYYYFNNSITQRIFSEEDNDFIRESYTTSNEADLKSGQVMAFLGFEGTLFYILVTNCNPYLGIFNNESFDWRDTYTNKKISFFQWMESGKYPYDYIDAIHLNC